MAPFPDTLPIGEGNTPSAPTSPATDRSKANSSINIELIFSQLHLRISYISLDSVDP